MPDRTKEFFANKKLVGLILAFCASFCVFPTFFEVEIFPVPSSGPSWLTLDPSWQITLSKVNLDNLTWGKDFVLTYGPLSYLSTRVGWGISKYHFILFDLFIAFNFFYIFFVSYIKSNNRKITSLLIIITSVLIPSYYGSGTALLLFIFLIFWIRQSLEQEKLLHYFMQTVIIVLAFYIKFNTGLIACVVFFAALIYKAVVTGENKLRLLAYFTAPVITIMLLAKILNVELIGYLAGGMELVSGYNEIMYLEEPYRNEFLFSLIFIFLTLSILLFKTYRERKVRVKNPFIIFLFSVSIFILYKQAFTRADIDHILEFYNYVLLLILCLQDFHYNQVGKNTNGIIIAVVFIAIFFAKKRDEHLVLYKVWGLKKDYFRGLIHKTNTSGFYLFPNNNQIPQRIKNKIGANGIDIYPWNTHLLIENKLNYSPRPVFQSYTAYTPFLENLNFNFYVSKRAPKFVIYEFDAIDGRYPLFDESKLNLLLLKNYSCVDTFSFAGRPVLILKKNDTINAELKFTRLKEYEIDSNAVIKPEKNRYYEVVISNTFSGKFMSVVDHAPKLFLQITTKNGFQRNYKTSRKLLETGIFSTAHFNSTLDFYRFMNTDSLTNENEIISYRIIRADPTLFTGKMRVIEYKIN